MFKNIGIVLKNSPTSGDSSVLNKLIKVLSSKTENIFSIDDVNIDRVKTLNIEEFNDLVDLIIVFGGDGTLLGAARKFINSQTPILGINMGTVGFLTDVNIENFESVVKDIFEGNYILEAVSYTHLTLPTKRIV